MSSTPASNISPTAGLDDENPRAAVTLVSSAPVPPAAAAPTGADPVLGRALLLARTYMPALAAAADAEDRSAMAASDRPASWAFAALVWRTATTSRTMDPCAWLATTGEADWKVLGFPRKPSVTHARSCLPAALKSRALQGPAARALVAVLADLAASSQLPGSHIDARGKRRILRRARRAA